MSMTTSRPLLTAVLALAALPPRAFAQAKSPQLASVLSQMDAASARFKSAEASVQYDIYTRVVHDHSLQSGSIYVEREGTGYTMGAVVYNAGPDNKPIRPAANVVNFDGKLLRSYVPGDNQVNVFKAAGNQARYETFLTLGFGGSGKDLAKGWAITDQGPEKLSEGTAQITTEKLDLVSNDPDVKKMFTHVTIWIDPARGISLKQIFYAPNGDSRTALYTNPKLNTHIDLKPYAIPKSASVINH